MPALSNILIDEYSLFHQFTKHVAHICIADGVPSSQNPKVAIDSWINHNKVERDEFSCVLQENLKVKIKSEFLALTTR